MDNLSMDGALAGLQDLLNSVGTPTEATAPSDTPDLASLLQDNSDPAEPVVNAPETPAATPKGRKKGSGKKTGAKKAAAKPEISPVAGPEAPSEGQGSPEPSEAPQEPAAETKPTKPKRIFFGRNVVGRLQHRLGDDLGKRLVLTTDDVDLPEAEFAAAVEAATAAFKAFPVKQQYLASMLLERATGRRSTLTPVLEGALRILASTRSLTSAALVARMTAGDRQHQKTTAMTQAGVALRTLEALKITVATKDGFEPNERSTLLALLSEGMALSFIDVEASIAEQEARDAEEAAKLAAGVVVETNEPEQGEAPVQAQGDADPVAALIDGTLNAHLNSELEALAAL